MERGLQSYSGKGKVKIADSWDGVAQWIGADTEVLKATIDEYNAFCLKKHDDVFAKEPRYLLPLLTPPYYAIQGCLEYVVIHGGLKINRNMEALDHQDRPIFGLYIAGVDVGGTDSDTYNANLPGHSFGFSINSGRIAAENATKYILRLL